MNMNNISKQMINFNETIINIKKTKLKNLQNILLKFPSYLYMLQQIYYILVFFFFNFYFIIEKRLTTMFSLAVWRVSFCIHF